MCDNGFPSGPAVKNLPNSRVTRYDRLGGVPWRRNMTARTNSTHWRIPWMRNLVDYSPYDHKVGLTDDTQHHMTKGLLVGAGDKESTCQCRTQT